MCYDVFFPLALHLKFFFFTYTPAAPVRIKTLQFLLPGSLSVFISIMRDEAVISEICQVISWARERDLEELFELITCSAEDDCQYEETDLLIIRDDVDDLAHQTLNELTSRGNYREALKDAWRIYHSRYFKAKIQEDYSTYDVDVDDDPFSENISVVDSDTFSFGLKSQYITNVFELPIYPPHATTN